VYRQIDIYWYTHEMHPISEMPFVGGDVALDFVNTAEERGHPECGDVLIAPADLRQWGERRGVVGVGAPSPDDDAELARAREARELLYGLLLARVRGSAADAGELERLAALAGDAYRAGSLEQRADGGVGWRWSAADLATVRHVAVTSAVALLATGSFPRLKQCPGDHCGWFFIDTTKRGNRRWCQMRECGQEAKDRRRREQRHARARA
jgi:predicted RNA-binding Zn ribbon-like protein